MTSIRIGTRKSDLALVQTALVREALLNIQPDHSVETVPLQTLGDKRQGTPEAGTLDKKAWIQELEEGILRGDIDLAIHSGKDVPLNTAAETFCLPVLQRATPFDVFIGSRAGDGDERIPLEQVPAGSAIGTASLRRKAALSRLRPDLQPVDLRGNVPTRVRKLDEAQLVQGIVVAAAGLERLGLWDLNHQVFSSKEITPALSQGTLVAQFLSKRTDLERLLYPLVEPRTNATYLAERRCAEILGADCSSAVGIFAAVRGMTVALHARVLSPDGGRCIESMNEGKLGDARFVGESVAKELLSQGAGELL